MSVSVLGTLLLYTAQLASGGTLAPTIDQSENRWRIAAEAQPDVAQRGIRIPVISYTAPDGSLKLKRGIVAGMRVAPNAQVGVGLFETLPKKKKSLDLNDDPMESKQRRSRKAAVGFSLRF